MDGKTIGSKRRVKRLLKKIGKVIGSFFQTVRFTKYSGLGTGGQSYPIGLVRFLFRLRSILTLENQTF